MQVKATIGETIWEDSAVIIKLVSVEDSTATVDVKPKSRFVVAQHPTPPLIEVEYLAE